MPSTDIVVSVPVITTLHKAATCFIALWNGTPVAFSAWLPMPYPGWKRVRRREHRTVTLPDYQGVGIGNALSAWCAAFWAAKGQAARSVTSHPGMIYARSKSSDWAMVKAPERKTGGLRTAKMKATFSSNRLTASFQYIGEPLSADVIKRFETT